MLSCTLAHLSGVLDWDDVVIHVKIALAGCVRSIITRYKSKTRAWWAILRSCCVFRRLILINNLLRAKCLWTYPVQIVFSKLILIHLHVIELLAVQILSVLLRAARVHVSHLAGSARSSNLTGLTYQAYFLLLPFVSAVWSLSSLCCGHNWTLSKLEWTFSDHPSDSWWAMRRQLRPTCVSFHSKINNLSGPWALLGVLRLVSSRWIFLIYFHRLSNLLNDLALAMILSRRVRNSSCIVEAKSYEVLTGTWMWLHQVLVMVYISRWAGRSVCT